MSQPPYCCPIFPQLPTTTTLIGQKSWLTHDDQCAAEAYSGDSGVTAFLATVTLLLAGGSANHPTYDGKPLPAGCTGNLRLSGFCDKLTGKKVVSAPRPISADPPPHAARESSAN